MRITKRDSTDERRVLIGMIVDSTVLGRVSSKWTDNMFRSRWANIIARWCMKYYKRYDKAPMGNIQSLYERWAAKTRDKEAVRLVSRFLESLSEEFAELKAESNSDYVIDVAGRHFNQVGIERLLESIQGDIDEGKVDEAHNRLIAHNKVDMGIGEGINILQDDEAIKEAFADKKEPLIIYPGALGEFFGEAFSRDSFVAFLGPEKRGKSFWLLDVAWRAMEQRRRVAFFEAGDSSKNQIMRRFIERVSRQPMSKRKIKYPIRIKRKSKKSHFARVHRKIKKFDKRLSWKQAKESCQKVMRKKIKSKKPYFKLSCHFNSTLKIEGIQSILQDWEKTGWIPDVIVIDYADILDMTYPGLEGRDLINQTWKQMRSLSQRYHCLVVTATQSDAKSYGKELIYISNFSEDKRKGAHVTGMIGINQTPDEKEKELQRLNWVALREAWFSETKCVHVAGCLSIANTAIKSCW